MPHPNPKNKLVVANWKMAITTTESAVELYNNIDFSYPLVICPSFLHLATLYNISAGNPMLSLGSQDCSAYNMSAATGEISAAMLADCGAKYVIIGHSERRSLLKEDSAQLQQKIYNAIDSGLDIIYCVGESKEQRDSNSYRNAISQQLVIIKHLNDKAKSQVIVAYEPIWAIGTALTPTQSEIAEIAHLIKTELGEGMDVLYGGSVNDQNIGDLLTIDKIDGFLIGGASADTDKLNRILRSVHQWYKNN